MMKRGLLPALGLLPLVVQAQTAEPFTVGGTIDLYYMPDSGVRAYEPFAGRSEVDGDGFGVAVLAPVSDVLALSGEYQKTTFEDSELALDQLRLGLELPMSAGSALAAEYTRFDLDGDVADGLGIHWRFSLPVGDGLALTGAAGYLMLQDDAGENLNGFEGAIGLDLAINPGAGAFLNYRVTGLEFEHHRSEIDFAQVRLGIRLYF